MAYLYQLLPLVENDNNLELLHDFLMENDFNIHIMFDIHGVQGNTLLHIANDSPENNLGAIRLIINAGADVNVANSTGNTPLHFAVKRRKHCVIDLLLQSGAHLSINAQSYYDVTPLKLAIHNFEDDSPPDVWIIRRLLQYEDLIINTTDHSVSPLLMAVYHDSVEVVELLLSHNANPNLGRDIYGGACLHAAFSYNEPNYYIVRQLLLHGADIYDKNFWELTPINILLTKVVDEQSLRIAMRCIKVVALYNFISEHLMRQLYAIPHLAMFVRNCCEEVERMKRDYITDSFTLHDFISFVYDKRRFSNHLLQVYKPVVEKLTHGFYLECFYDIFDHIPNKELRKIAEIVVRSVKTEKNTEEDKFIELFSKVEIQGFCEFLSRLDTFYIIVAFSNVRISQTLHDLRRRWPWF